METHPPTRPLRRRAVPISSRRPRQARLELDKVTWNLPYEPSSIDPAKTFNYAENTATANLVENLLRLRPDFTIEPGLAESFTNPSPTTWVYKIREGVTFWDGKPMTADDVVYSLQRNMDPDVGSFFAYYYANVEKIEKTGEYEVTVTLKKPDVLFNEAMATPAGAVLEKAYCEAKGVDFGTPKGGVMGTGPFKFVELAVGHVDDPRTQRCLLGHAPFSRRPRTSNCASSPTSRPPRMRCAAARSTACTTTCRRQP